MATSSSFMGGFRGSGHPRIGSRRTSSGSRMVSLSNTGTSSRTRRLRSSPRAAGRCSATRFRYTGEQAAQRAGLPSLHQERNTQMKLTGNTILITGGGSGIGRGLAVALHKRGNQVIIAGRRKSHLEATTKANPGMASVELDLQDPKSIASVAKKLIAQ